MERIIQITASDSTIFCLTNEGRIFFKRTGEADWLESSLPPLHTNEIDHTDKSHSCTQCVEVNAQNILTTPN